MQDMQKLRDIMKWVETDGLLHFLVSYSMMLALHPIIGTWSVLITATFGFIKEAKDYFVEKDNSPKQLLHDLICDGVGIVAAYATMLIWIIVN